MLQRGFTPGCASGQDAVCGSVEPRGWEVLAANAMRSDPDAIVWRGDLSLPVQQGVKVLGTPLGSPEYVQAMFESLSTSHQRLVDRVPHITDLQSAGCSCCSSLRLAQITSSGWCTLKPFARSLPATTVHAAMYGDSSGCEHHKPHVGCCCYVLHMGGLGIRSPV